MLATFFIPNNKSNNIQFHTNNYSYYLLNGRFLLMSFWTTHCGFLQRHNKVQNLFTCFQLLYVGMYTYKYFLCWTYPSPLIITVTLNRTKLSSWTILFRCLIWHNTHLCVIRHLKYYVENFIHTQYLIKYNTIPSK